MAGEIAFLTELEEIIRERKENRENGKGSYTASLFESGLDKILQKVGEESVEYIIDAKNRDRARFLSEGADLLYHFMVSLAALDVSLSDVTAELKERHQKKS